MPQAYIKYLYNGIRSIKNDGNNEYLTVHNSMYIAGLPEETGEKALKLWHLRNATSFNGRDLGFDSFRLIDLGKKYKLSKHRGADHATCNSILYGTCVMLHVKRVLNRVTAIHIRYPSCTEQAFWQPPSCLFLGPSLTSDN